MKGTAEKINCNNCLTICTGDRIFSNEEIELLKKNKKDIRYNKGETIFKQGSFADHIIFVHSGLVKITIETKNNKTIIIDIISAGNFIGLSTIEMIDYYPFTVTALKDTTVCLIKAFAVKQFIKNNTEFNSIIIKHQSVGLLNIYKKISLIGSRNNHGRLAEALLYLSDPKLSEEDVMSHITRKDIADLACISLESVNKILIEMKNDLIIDVDRKKIAVRNEELLKLLSVIG